MRALLPRIANYTLAPNWRRRSTLHEWAAARYIDQQIAVNIEQCVFAGFCKRQNPASLAVV